MSIDVLRKLGTDAFINLYDIFIPAVSGINGFEGIEFRVKNFPIPETPSVNTYEIHYKTMKMVKLGSKIDMENEITFPLRVDRNWVAYNFFLAWKKLGISQETGVIDETLIPKVPLVVKSTDTQNNGTGGVWTFSNFYPRLVGGIDFDWEGDSPIEVDITGIYDLFVEEVIAI